jgi:RimJ/RimL family protein N-acetyltransferase
VTRGIPTLRTERLTLRAPRLDDMPSVLAQYSDAEVARHIGDGAPSDEVAVWRAMAAWLGEWHLRDHGLWAIEVDGVRGGDVSVHRPEGWRDPEIGWSLVRRHWGQGMATEAATLVIDWAWSHLDPERLISYIQPGNARSLRLASRLCARKAETVLLNGIPHEVWEHPRPEATRAAPAAVGATPLVEAPVIGTERLRLRGFRAEDLDAYAAMSADPEVMRFIGGGGPISREIAYRSMAFFLGHWQLLGHGMWAVEERETGRLVGRAGLQNPAGWPDLEIGWTLARDVWGRGYATEAARAAIAWQREILGDRRLISLIRPQNRRSQAVARRLGAQLEETIDFWGAPAEVWVHRRCAASV